MLDQRGRQPAAVGPARSPLRARDARDERATDCTDRARARARDRVSRGRQAVERESHDRAAAPGQVSQRPAMMARRPRRLTASSRRSFETVRLPLEPEVQRTHQRWLDLGRSPTRRADGRDVYRHRAHRAHERSGPFFVPRRGSPATCKAALEPTPHSLSSVPRASLAHRNGCRGPLMFPSGDGPPPRMDRIVPDEDEDAGSSGADSRSAPATPHRHRCLCLLRRSCSCSSPSRWYRRTGTRCQKSLGRVDACS